MKKNSIRRKLAWLTVPLALFGLGAVAWTQLRRPSPSAVLRGRKIAYRLGCFGCHPLGGEARHANPGSPLGVIPSWRSGEVEMYIKKPEDIHSWILRSVQGSHLASAGHDQLTGRKGVVPMPAYAGLLSTKELEDLTAYFQAVAGWYPGMPDGAYEGWQVATRTGCFGCHGPSGRGGVPNPRSFKGTIPPWDSEDFGELVRDDKELSEWILDGTSSRLMENPFARYFLRNQVIQMPAYREHLTGTQLDLLRKYIHWLREQ